MAGPPEADRRQLTVLFCDLVGSTELASRLDPEDMGALMRTYHAACQDVVTRWGGHVAKFMGDGVLAYFGIPTPTRTMPNGRCVPASIWPRRSKV